MRRPTSTTDLPAPPGILSSSNAGFTLVELLVVLVIAAAAAAWVGVNGQAWLERSSHEAALRDLEGFLRQARQQALERGQPVEVRWDEARQTLVADGLGSLALPPGTVVMAAGPGERMAILDGMAFVFGPDGSAVGHGLRVARDGAGVAILFRPNWALGTVERVVVDATAAR